MTHPLESLRRRTIFITRYSELLDAMCTLYLIKKSSDTNICIAQTNAELEIQMFCDVSENTLLPDESLLWRSKNL